MTSLRDMPRSCPRVRSCSLSGSRFAAQGRKISGAKGSGLSGIVREIGNATAANPELPDLLEDSYRRWMASLPVYFEQRLVGTIHVDRGGPSFTYASGWIGLKGAAAHARRQGKVILTHIESLSSASDERSEHRCYFRSSTISCVPGFVHYRNVPEREYVDCNCLKVKKMCPDGNILGEGSASS